VQLAILNELRSLPMNLEEEREEVEVITLLQDIIGY
jgi:hypothetical protein